MANERIKKAGGRLKSEATKKALDKAIKEYEARARTPASKAVQDELAIAIATAIPGGAALGSALKGFVKAGTIYKKAGLDRLIKNLVQAYGKGTSPATKVKARALLNLARRKTGTNKLKVGKDKEPYVEIKTPVQRPKSVRAQTQRKKAMKEALKKDTTGAKTKTELLSQVRKRKVPEIGSAKPDVTKIRVTKDMIREAGELGKTLRTRPLKRVLKGTAATGGTYAGAKGAQSMNEERYGGGKVMKYRKGGKVRGAGIARQGVRKCKYV